MADQYDIIVIGGGPGGYVAAIRAAQLGFKTAVVDREHLGGICLNWGCIPTKALLRSAEIFHYLQHPKDYGLTIEGKVGFDASAIVKRSRDVSARLSAGVGFLMKKNKIDVIWGEAATGARPRVLPGIEPDGKLIWTYFEAMVPKAIPKSLLVMGSGAIGMEFASFFRTLGSEVTV